MRSWSRQRPNQIYSSKCCSHNFISQGSEKIPPPSWHTNAGKTPGAEPSVLREEDFCQFAQVIQKGGEAMRAETPLRIFTKGGSADIAVRTEVSDKSKAKCPGSHSV